MSIVALKKKTAAKYNNMSVGVSQFSINGGHRNQMLPVSMFLYSSRKKAFAHKKWYPS